jgi:hypothetical protein
MQNFAREYKAFFAVFVSLIIGLAIPGSVVAQTGQENTAWQLICTNGDLQYPGFGGTGDLALGPDIDSDPVGCSWAIAPSDPDDTPAFTQFFEFYTPWMDFSSTVSQIQFIGSYRMNTQSGILFHGDNSNQFCFDVGLQYTVDGQERTDWFHKYIGGYGLPEPHPDADQYIYPPLLANEWHTPFNGYGLNETITVPGASRARFLFRLNPSVCWTNSLSEVPNLYYFYFDNLGIRATLNPTPTPSPTFVPTATPIVTPTPSPTPIPDMCPDGVSREYRTYDFLSSWEGWSAYYGFATWSPDKLLSVYHAGGNKSYLQAYVQAEADILNFSYGLSLGSGGQPTVTNWFSPDLSWSPATILVAGSNFVPQGKYWAFAAVRDGAAQYSLDWIRLQYRCPVSTPTPTGTPPTVTATGTPSISTPTVTGTPPTATTTRTPTVTGTPPTATAMPTPYSYATPTPSRTPTLLPTATAIPSPTGSPESLPHYPPAPTPDFDIPELSLPVLPTLPANNISYVPKTDVSCLPRPAWTQIPYVSCPGAEFPAWPGWTLNLGYYFAWFFGAVLWLLSVLLCLLIQVLNLLIWFGNVFVLAFLIFLGALKITGCVVAHGLAVFMAFGGAVYNFSAFASDFLAGNISVIDTQAYFGVLGSSVFGPIVGFLAAPLPARISSVIFAVVTFVLMIRTVRNISG